MKVVLEIKIPDGGVNISTNATQREILFNFPLRFEDEEKEKEKE
jgi:hypothetical protein